MMYELEPLEINLPVPDGTYNVTLSIKAHSETVFSVFEDSIGFILEDSEIEENGNRDILFKVATKDGINIKIYCDGRLTATAMAEHEDKKEEG